MIPSIAMYKNSIKHQSFVYTQLNDQAVLFQTIQFCISTQFFIGGVLSLCKDAVGVFFGPSRLDHKNMSLSNIDDLELPLIYIYIYIYIYMYICIYIYMYVYIYVHI